MNKRKFLWMWSVAVGAMDAVTGLMLVTAPALVLWMLDITPPPAESLVFLSWIGVFVGAVGLSYGMALGEPRRGKAVWMFTAMVRLLVGVFVAGQIAGGALAAAWGMVALTDLSVAVVQLWLIGAGWWEEGER